MRLKFEGLQTDDHENIVSIPTGAIKIGSTHFVFKLNKVSIPTGAIKIRNCGNRRHGIKVSIPTGAIKIGLGNSQ